METTATGIYRANIELIRQADAILGLGENDRLQGLGGNDLLEGGTGFVSTASQPATSARS